MPDASIVPPDADRRAVSTMLEFSEVHRQDWQPDELRQMLRHQLAAPLQISLGTLSGEIAHVLRQARPAVNPLMSLGQLLALPQPPVEALKLVKRFAKLCRGDPENALPSEIVMLLYYASIAAAMTRSKQQITDLPPRPLLRGLRWLSAQPWVDESVRTLLRDGLAELESTQAQG